MGFCLDGSVSTSGSFRKGVSPVIATVLLVMVTIVLVFVVNEFFNNIISVATTDTEKALKQNQIMSQRIVIPTAYGCGSYICFEVKSLGTNEFPLSMENSGYFLDSVPKQVYPWAGTSLGPDCLDNPTLQPGESCYGRIQGPCNSDDMIKVTLSVGIEGFRMVSRCN